MKKLIYLLVPASIAIFLCFEKIDNIWSQNTENTGVTETSDNKNAYKFPSFYRGIYLTVDSARNMGKLSHLVTASRDARINAMVLDIHTSRYETCQVSRENVEFCLKNGIHPIARIVVFPDGLKRFPVPENEIQARIELAEKACQNGFREIQFDYIRFNDYKVLGHLTLQQKYDFIEGFLARARTQLKKYDAKIAADVFGRIPLNNKDSIGQRMEGLDKVVDIICPMAYPSHYTWSQKLMADPYHTVFLTSKRAKERVKNAEIVTYIQAFKMKLGASGMSYDKYIEEQIRAVHDAGIKGYLMWNARQDYVIPLQVVKNYYLATPKMITTSDEKNQEERRLIDRL